MLARESGETLNHADPRSGRVWCHGGDHTGFSGFQSSRLQFHKDMKDAQELLRKVDSDLNQKYSPDFKDRYQIELLLRELDVSAAGVGTARGGRERGGHDTRWACAVGLGCDWGCRVLASHGALPCAGAGEGIGQVRARGAGPAAAGPAGVAPKVPPGDAPQARACGGSV